MRRWERLQEAVRSLARQTRPVLETYVVCDHNAELLAAARAELPDAHVLENTRTRGAAGSRNAALGLTRGDVVAFLDDDAVAEPDWVEEMLRGYEDDGVLGVGGHLEPVWASTRPPWFPPEFDWVVGCSYVGLPREQAPVRNLIAANMSARRDVLLELGGFAGELGRMRSDTAGTEETDLCIRGLQRWPDRRWLYRPSARVRHHVTPERERWGYFVRRCWGEGVSKAAMVEGVGSAQGLAAERAYATRTLPRAVVRHLRARLAGQDPGGALRAGAVLAGLAVTAGGYAVGTVQRHRPA